MDVLAVLAMCMGLYDATSYSAVQERMAYPDDYVLRSWISANWDYRVELIKQRDALSMSCSRPACREAAHAWYSQELEEAARIHRIMWQIADVNFNSPPQPYKEMILREWFARAREWQTPTEQAARYVPWGGLPEAGWRARRKTN